MKLKVYFQIFIQSSCTKRHDFEKDARNYVLQAPQRNQRFYKDGTTNTTSNLKIEWLSYNSKNNDT